MIYKFIKYTTMALSFSMATIAFAEEGELKNVHGNEEHEEHGHKNHVALFLGATTFLGDHAEHLFTAGIDYEYRIMPLIGAGVLADFPIRFSGYEFEGIFAPFIAVHPAGGLKVILAPGIEIVAGEFGFQAFVMRVGTGYDFHLGSVSIGPSVSYDYTVHHGGHSAIVYGLAAGTGF